LKTVNFSKPFYLISDTHYYHTKLFFEFGLRKEFKTTEEVNALMFKNWNDTVSDDDYVIFLGDFVCGTQEHGLDKYKTAQVIYDGLNGKKIFFKGSHDNGLKRFTNIPVIEDSLEIIYKDTKILLSHKPILNFTQNISIHGHIHRNSPFHYKQNCFNVSCEVVNYTPVNIDTILKLYQIEIIN